jgi:hypothetical protein
MWNEDEIGETVGKVEAAVGQAGHKEQQAVAGVGTAAKR